MKKLRTLLAGFLSLGGSFTAAESPKFAEPGVPGGGVVVSTAIQREGGGSDPAPAAASACETLCKPCGPCGPAGHFWVNAEMVYWIASGNPTPSLITAAAPGSPLATAGQLGATGTTTLVGGRRLNDDFRAGFRVTAGTWLNCDQTCGLEGDYFYLGQSRQAFRAGSGGSQIVARPFFNAFTNQPDSQLVSFPGILAGFVSVDSKSDVTGGGFNFLKNCVCSPCARLDVIVGYRYFNARDEIIIREDLTSLAGQPVVPVGTRFAIEDRFRTENNFHGGNVGVVGERRFGHCYVGYRASVALGVNHQVTEISGFTVVNSPAPANLVNARFPGGLLTQPTNIGRYTNDEFAVLPEVGLRLGCQFTPRIRGYIGGNFLYLSNAQRAGDAINLRVNPTQIAPFGALVGPAEPRFMPKTTDLWVQGITVGVEGRY